MIAEDGYATSQKEAKCTKKEVSESPQRKVLPYLDFRCFDNVRDKTRPFV